MKKNLFLFVCFLALSPLFAQNSAELGIPLPPSAFFSEFQGDYQILLSGDHVPKEDNNLGSVLIEGNEGLMIFPYCHQTGGVCDPGFRSFPLDSTQVYKKEVDTDYQVYTFLVPENGKTRQFVWEQRNKVSHFKDLEYTLISGEVFPLEFIAEIAPAQPHRGEP